MSVVEATDMECMVLVLGEVSVRCILMVLLHLELAGHDNIAYAGLVMIRVKFSAHVTNFDYTNPVYPRSNLSRRQSEPTIRRYKKH
jgi:hypothetical protein